MTEFMNHLIAIVNMITDRHGVIAPHAIAFQFFHSFDGLIKVLRGVIFGRVRHKSSRAEKAANLILVMLSLSGFAGNGKQ